MSDLSWQATRDTEVGQDGGYGRSACPAHLNGHPGSAGPVVPGTNPLHKGSSASSHMSLGTAATWKSNPAINGGSSPGAPLSLPKGLSVHCHSLGPPEAQLAEGPAAPQGHVQQPATHSSSQGSRGVTRNREAKTHSTRELAGVTMLLIPVGEVHTGHRGWAGVHL